MKTTKMILLLAALMLAGCNDCKKQQSASENKNAVIENMMARRSIRKYKQEPLNREVVDELLWCGINAPNGMNRQSWEIRVVDDAALLKDISAVYLSKNTRAAQDSTFKNMFRNAPTVVFVGNDTSVGCSQIDCGLFTENVLLAATSKGIGSIVMTGPIAFLNNTPEAADFVKRLGFSEGYELLLCIGLGYADEAPAAKPRDLSKIRYVE